MNLRVLALMALAGLTVASNAPAGPYEDAHAAHEKGDGVAYLKIIQPLAGKGEARAERDLGAYYLEGWGGTKDSAKALIWLRKAVDQGDAEAESALATMYIEGNGVPQDDLQALALIKKAAAQKDESVIGPMMAIALPHKRANLPAIAATFRAEGDKGDQLAQGMLLSICMTSALPGETTEKLPADDCAAALNWVKARADKGDAKSRIELARIYDLGVYPGVTKDSAKAAGLERQAAESGDAAAQSSLAMRYEFGMGVDADKAKALEWRLKAAAQGELTSEMSLADHYADDTNPDHDATRAFYWNEKVAEQGMPDAQRKVGAAYAIGHGVPRDDVKAYIWLTVANQEPNILLRDKDSEDLSLSAVAARLTPAQMTEALKQAVALKAKIDSRSLGGVAKSADSKPSS